MPRPYKRTNAAPFPIPNYINKAAPHNAMMRCCHKKGAIIHV